MYVPYVYIILVDLPLSPLSVLLSLPKGQAMATSDLLALDGYADGAHARGMLSGTTHTALARDLRLSHHHRDQRPSWRSPFVTFAYPSQGSNPPRSAP